VNSSRLDYSAGVPRRVGWVRLTWLLLAAVVIALLAWWRQDLWFDAQVTYYKWQCVRYVAPANRAISPPPRCLAFFLEASRPPHTLLFMHQRVTPGGRKRLVVIGATVRFTPELASEAAEYDRPPLPPLWEIYYNASVVDLDSPPPAGNPDVPRHLPSLANIGPVLDGGMIRGSCGRGRRSTSCTTGSPTRTTFRTSRSRFGSMERFE
jgi:hypothetical protein